MTRRRTRKTGAPTSSSPQSEPMTQKIFASLLAGAIVLAAAPARAANKEHQQLMADLRILQEQSQQLQNLLGTLNDAIKAVNTRLDQQAEATRKAFADQQLVITNLTNDVRIIREKLDDNNVRIGSLTQEVDSLRHSMQQINVAAAARVSCSTNAADGVARGVSRGADRPVGARRRRLRRGAHLGTATGGRGV